MLKKLTKITVASLLAFTSSFASVSNVFAKSVNNGDVITTEKANKVTIGNDAIEREFDYTNNKLTTSFINNKLGKTTLNPAQGSEEFEIRLLSSGSQESAITKPSKKLDTTGWSATSDSVATNEGSNGSAQKVLDGNDETYYHSKYSSATTEELQYPHNIYVDMKEEKTISSMRFQERLFNGQQTASGRVKGFNLYVGKTLDEVKSSTTPILTGEFKNAKETYVNLKESVKTQFIRVEFTSCYQPASGASADVACCSELNFYEDKVVFPEKNREFVRTSDLTLDGAPIVESTTKVINNVTKTGKMITFKFKPINTGNNNEMSVVQKVVMYNGDHFMRKFLEIEMSNKTQRIDYIDGEHLQMNEEDSTWTAPEAGAIVMMHSELAKLGQPIYVNGLFLGSEFPAAKNAVDADKLGVLRYYTGKNFEDFQRDNQLTTDGKYVSWQTVVGASATDNTDTNAALNIAKKSLFDYIDTIKTPSDFRIQYNSWFDNMMLISDENILESFSAVDKHFSQTGVRPLDSYVVDDGWNNYNNGRIVDAGRSGTTFNETGFWEFNNKFPKGLTPSSQLVQNFGSNFGVWVGPRGGYNFYTDLANIVTKSGKGSKAGGSVDVADRTYVKNFQEMAIKWQKNYGVNYWKWDGFADWDQFGAFAKGQDVVGRKNNHMYGGVDGMYHVTDLWEAWIDLFEAVRASEKADGINKLWISLTCYINPSPWYLQWANSIWIQCGADRGEVSNNVLNNKMDNMLTYRDACYYEFFEHHKFQLPLENLYNHDPIYGTEGTGITKNSMNAEEFKNYMFMQGTRGTAFWELYYSDSIFDEEKYLINADFLEWEEANFDILRNNTMIGGHPSDEVRLQGGASRTSQNTYGFAGFNAEGTEGIISMRNPSNAKKTITFTVDQAMGAKKASYFVKHEHDYVTPGFESEANIPATINKDQSVTVTLQPGEVHIIKLTETKDEVKPVLNKIYVKDATIVQVQASEHITDGAFTVTVDGQEVAVKAMKAFEDSKTFDLTLAKPLTKGQNVNVSAKAGKDNADNLLIGNVSLKYYENGLVANKQVVNETVELSNAKNSIEGKNGFTVSMEAKTTAKDVVLLQQGNDYKLGIDQNGRAYFELNGTRTTSKEVVATGESYILTGVKENNGIIKLYVDGNVNSSKYDAKNMNFEVKADAITVNGNGSTLSDVRVYNESLGYDEVPTLPLATLVEKVENERHHYSTQSWNDGNLDALLETAKTVLAKGEKAAMATAYDALYDGYKKLVPTQVNLALKKEASAHWVDQGQTAPNTNNGSPLSLALDGKHNDAGKHAIIGKDGIATPVYMQIDLGDEYAISRAQLYRYWLDSRMYDSTALVVSSDKDFADKTVLYYSGEGDKFQLGTNPTQALYNESNAGKELYNGKEVNARYVRLYVSGRKQSNPTENHIVELEIYGKLADPYNVKELETLIQDAEALVQDSKYTEASVAALNAKITSAKEVVKAVKADTQEDKTIGYVLNAKEALSAAMASLEVKKADVTFSGLSLSLADYIGVNYYFELSEKVLADDQAYMLFTREDNTTVKFTMDEVKANTKVVNGKTLYRATVPMAARSMSDIINGKVVLSNGEEVVLKDTSVQSYAKTILTNEDKYSTEAVAAVKAMLNYGAAAQVKFDNKVDSLANAILSKEDQVVNVDNSVFDQYQASKEGSVAGIEYFGTSVLLKSKTGISHYFTLAEGANIENYTFKVNGEVLQPQYRDGKYYVDINNIFAKNLADTYVLEVSDGNDTMSVTFGVFSYAKIVVNGNYSEELKAVVRAMYPYYVAADAYAKSVK